MPFQIVSPFVMTIDGSSLKSAIKNFVKVHHSLKLNNIIVADQDRHIKATFNYYKNDGRNRVGIDVYPHSHGIIATSPIVSPVSSIVSPVVPSVFNVPAVNVGKVTSSSGTMVGNDLDMGPTLANIVSPIMPTIVSATSPIVTKKGSNVLATANNVVVTNSNLITSTPVSFFPTIVSIN
tara:strand:- start:10 stop:546 length:537 start_codon:yes stop_codon:yes gene_type:complete